MYLLTGITGHVGGAAARALLNAGKKVRALVRDVDTAQKLFPEVEMVKGDLTDRGALERALAGVDGVFILVPPQNREPDPIGTSRRMIETYAPLVARAKNIVVLSSHGADQDGGTGFIYVAYLLEQALKGAPATMIRAGSFFENYEHAVATAKATGTYNTFLGPLDRKFPFIASEDIGKQVAHWLQQPPAQRIIELGTMTSPNDVAAALTKAVGRDVTAQWVTREHWDGALAAMHMPPHARALFVEMQDAIQSGRISFERPDAIRVDGTLALEQFFQRLA
ncbi:MAG TPA: NmrA family NAD(P)-binding protein [Kofleriaceae bacterium]|jgi:uncharacterized protein YbjT (DUF2867 family)